MYLVDFHRIAQITKDWSNFCNGEGHGRYPIEMLHWTLTFLFLAVVAGVFGFGSLSGVAAMIAQVLSSVFMVLLIAAGFTQVFLGTNRF